MLNSQPQQLRQERGRFIVCLADSEAEVREAQRLRYKVFAEEMGARLSVKEPGLDKDMYDAYCDHLLVRETDTNEVVGTYRILSPMQARRLGGFYSDDEFDLTRLAYLRSRMVEVGRSCVHPAYRGGGVIALLWSGLASYMKRSGYDYLIGCASMGMVDGGHRAASIYRQIMRAHMSPIEWRVFPRCALPLEALRTGEAVCLPPLVKGYLRLGAYVCGDPAWDPDFNTADLLMLLPMAKLDGRYARRFLGS
ncbi:MAG: GNAT family N-acetyltransferase [Betaproteobacteria bacterium]|nr:GNAT family N-acetyltransferase [Betaproteobacteria bacterium]